MSRTSQILLSTILLALVAVAATAQTGLLKGQVIDTEGNPVAGARLTVTTDDQPSYREVLTTDKDGEFKVRFLRHQADYLFELKFEKPGYQTFVQPMSPSTTQQMREEYVMEKGETQVIETHGDLGSVVTGSSSLAVDAFNAGITAQKAGDLATARTSFEQAISEDPDLGPAHVALAQVLLDLREFDAALASAETALALDAAKADSLTIKYQALSALGRDAEAEATAAELEEAQGALVVARSMYNEGAVAFQAGDVDTAFAKFSKAAELDSSLIDAHHAIATIQLSRGNNEAAADSAERALALGSEDVRTLRVLFDAYDAMGRTEEVAEIAPRLAAVDPEFGGAKLVEQAAALWNSGNTEKAIRLSQLALTIDPQLAKAHYFIGLDHVSRGENAAARAALETFIGLAPEDPDAAVAREMLGHLE